MATLPMPSTPPPRKKAKIVTPEEKKKDEYVPKYLHKNVEYQRAATKDLPERTRKAFAVLVRYCELPEDLEQSRRYGPLSGSSYEERALAAYGLGYLDTDVDICTACGSEGHRKSSCPELV